MNAITLDFSRAARKLHFNTGRRTTSHGQRLAVWVVPSVGEACHGAACFVDFDRDITGYFPIQLRRGPGFGARQAAASSRS